MHLVFLGPPGVGKGTQAKRTAEEFGILHVSTGDLLRENVRNDTELGREAKPYMESGQLVPDLLIVRVTMDRIRRPDCARGVLLDGFPRTTPQALALDQALTQARLELTAACFFNAPDEVLIERMSGRRSCAQCGAGYHVRTLTPRVEGVCDVCYGTLVQRADDKPEVIAERIQVYRRQSAGVVDHYRAQGILREIPSQGSVDEIFGRVLEALRALTPEARVHRNAPDAPAAIESTIETSPTEAISLPPGFGQKARESALGGKRSAARKPGPLPVAAAKKKSKPAARKGAGKAPAKRKAAVRKAAGKNRKPAAARKIGKKTSPRAAKSKRRR